MGMPERSTSGGRVCDSVKRFADREIAPIAAQVDRENTFPHHLWRKLGDLGVLGITVEEDYGGVDMGYLAHVVAQEEISRASASIGLSYGAHSNLCVNQLRKNGTLAQKQAYLPKLVSGEHVGALTMSETEAGEFVLEISFYPPNTFMWLSTNGYMTVTNIESALRSKDPLAKSLAAGQLVDAIVEMDPDMDLLLAVLAKNYLGAAELLHAIRRLMASLDFLGETPSTKQGLLTNGGEIRSEDIEEQLATLEAEAEQYLELAEYQLGPGSGVRSDALSVALSKLYRCPNRAIIQGLQTTFTTQEIVGLVYLLRFELSRGSWITRYLQSDDAEVADTDAEGPNNAIVLISSLLNNCVDAVGAGGWLTGEARLVDGDPFEAEDLIHSLKLEVSAALEGIEEAVYLKGLTAEMIRYGDGVQAALPKSSSETQTEKRSKPIVLPALGQDIRTLPLGLKAEKQISLLKVAAGGAVYQRTRRDIGHLKSQKVGKYSRERIVV